MNTRILKTKKMIEQIESKYHITLSGLLNHWDYLNNKTMMYVTDLFAECELIKGNSVNFDISSNGLYSSDEFGIVLLTDNLVILQKHKSFDYSGFERYIPTEESEFEEYVRKIKVLHDAGINIPETYCCWRSTVNKATEYQIQERIYGVPIGTQFNYKSENPSVDLRMNELNAILNAPEMHLSKLIKDWIVLNNSIRTDAFNPTNIMYSNKKGYQIIDFDYGPAKCCSDIESVREIITMMINAWGLQERIAESNELMDFVNKVIIKIGTVVLQDKTLSLEEFKESVTIACPGLVSEVVGELKNV